MPKLINPKIKRKSTRELLESFIDFCGQRFDVLIDQQQLDRADIIDTRRMVKQLIHSQTKTDRILLSHEQRITALER